MAYVAPILPFTKNEDPINMHRRRRRISHNFSESNLSMLMTVFANLRTQSYDKGKAAGLAAARVFKNRLAVKKQTAEGSKKSSKKGSRDPSKEATEESAGNPNAGLPDADKLIDKNASGNSHTTFMITASDKLQAANDGEEPSDNIYVDGKIDPKLVLKLPLGHTLRVDPQVVEKLMEWINQTTVQGFRWGLYADMEEFSLTQSFLQTVIEKVFLDALEPNIVVADDDDNSFIVVLTGRLKKVMTNNPNLILDECIPGQSIGMGCNGPKEIIKGSMWITTEKTELLIIEDSFFDGTDWSRIILYTREKYKGHLETLFPKAKPTLIQKLVLTARMKTVAKNSIVLDLHSDHNRQCVCLLDASLTAIVDKKEVDTDTSLLTTPFCENEPIKLPKKVPGWSLHEGIISDAMIKEATYFTLKATRHGTILVWDQTHFKLLSSLLGQPDDFRETMQKKNLMRIHRIHRGMDAEKILIQVDRRLQCASKDEMDRDKQRCDPSNKVNKGMNRSASMAATYTSGFHKTKSIDGSQNNPMGALAPLSFPLPSDIPLEQCHKKLAEALLRNRRRKLCGGNSRIETLDLVTPMLHASATGTLFNSTEWGPDTNSMFMSTSSDMGSMMNTGQENMTLSRANWKKKYGRTQDSFASSPLPPISSMSSKISRQQSLMKARTKFAKYTYRKNFLILTEDESTMQLTTRVLLFNAPASTKDLIEEEKNCSTFFVKTKMEVLRALGNRALYNVLILDQPAKDVIPLLRCIRSLPMSQHGVMYGDVPVIVLSNTPDVPDVLRETCSYILVKPVSQKGLRDALIWCLERQFDPTKNAPNVEIPNEISFTEQQMVSVP